jgi:beta-lactamase class D
MRIFLFCCLIIISALLCAQRSDTIDAGTLFGSFDGGFRALDLQTGNTVIINPLHCATRYSPCSTFKIPNSLIGLETGVIPDTSFVIPWDSILHPRDPEMMKSEQFRHWFSDLSLKNAFRYSCVWYYQELARRVGAERMQELLDQTGYGNMDISSGADKFWLCGSIQISVDEQVQFIKRLYYSDLPGISAENIQSVKDIMLYESAPGFQLYGKTGGGDCWEDRTIGWYVGFVETPTGPKIFAMNVIVNSFDDLKNNYRIELTKQILKSTGWIK